MQASEHAHARRFDIYLPIHKALRACLSDTLVRVGAVDGADEAAVDGAIAQVREMAAFCAAHLKKENDFVHPAMEARLPGSTSAIAGDHDHHDWAIDRIGELCDQVAAARGVVRDDALLALYRYLAVFVGENLLHMNAEEVDHNAVLWATHSDAEIIAIEQAIVGSLGPDEKAISMRWMLPALSHAERVAFLGGMRAAVPAFVFEGVIGIARAHLQRGEFAKLSAALGLEERLAA